MVASNSLLLHSGNAGSVWPLRRMSAKRYVFRLAWQYADTQFIIHCVNLQFCSSNLRLRTKKMYEKHCEHLSTLGAEHAATVYGVNRNAALNRLKYFHVVDGLPPDVMHDMLEGVVNCEVKIMLQIYIYEKRLFTLKQLNSRMKFFRCV